MIYNRRDASEKHLHLKRENSSSILAGAGGPVGSFTTGEQR